MSDNVSPEKRKQMMSNIRGKNTKPEIFLRKGLHQLGFRFRLHSRLIPGKPDIVFPKYQAVIFVHGCFWHGHGCHLFKWPSTRKDFWYQKITQNRERDHNNLTKLTELGWRICIVWECSLKGKYRLPDKKVVEDCAEWLKSDAPYLEVNGYPACKEE